MTTQDFVYVPVPGTALFSFYQPSTSQYLTYTRNLWSSWAAFEADLRTLYHGVPEHDVVLTLAHFKALYDAGHVSP
jgi:hypothetical protein